MTLMKAEMRKQYHRDLINFIMICALYPLASVAIMVLFYRYTAFSFAPLVFVPVFVRWAQYRIPMLKSDHEIMRLFKLDKADYADYMKLYSNHAELTCDDQSKAVELFITYRDTYEEKHDELVALLKSEIKRRPPDKLSVGMLAGLIFLSGKCEDYELLFRAKYRCGEVGTFIPDIWLRALDQNFPELYQEHQTLSHDFIAWWDHKTGRQ